MAYDNSDQNDLIQNPTNGDNPLADMRDDEELDQDYNPPFTDADDDDGESGETSEALKTHPQTDAGANDNQQQTYNEALADALEISPTK